MIVGRLLGLVPTVFYMVIAYFLFLTSKGVKDKKLKLFGEVLAWVLIVLAVASMLFGSYCALTASKVGMSWMMCR